MNTIIEKIITTIEAGDKLNYVPNFPIKIVHKNTRVKETNILEQLDTIEFFDKDGFSSHQVSQESINFLQKNGDKYLQTVSYAIANVDNYDSYKFQEKFPNDKWKKIVDDGTLEAVIEVSNFTKKSSAKDIETHLRDLMRSRKEVPLLKKVGFVWIAYLETDQDISNIMQHYFLENFTKISTQHNTIFIGWNKKLQDINMRYFVYPPNA